jgi:hypothetical protein
MPSRPPIAVPPLPLVIFALFTLALGLPGLFTLEGLLQPAARVLRCRQAQMLAAVGLGLALLADLSRVFYRGQRRGRPSRMPAAPGWKETHRGSIPVRNAGC